MVDKISMIKLEMLFNLKKQLAKAYTLLNSSIAIFGDFPIVIVIKNFY